MASSSGLGRILLAAAAACAIAAAQTGSRPAGVDGTVVNALTGEPLSKAHVSLKASIQGTLRKYGAMANEQGRFSIKGIEPGNYRTSVDLPGFLFAPQRAEDNGHVDVAEHASVSNLKLRLIPQGVIAGHLLDANGDPVEGAVVSAVRGARYVGQQRTDAAGEFRISGLPAGKYLVEAIPVTVFALNPPEVRTDGTREERNGPTWFPSAPQASSAAPVEVHAGTETGGLEIRLAPMPVVRVSGTMTGVPAERERVNLLVSTPFFERLVYPNPHLVLWGLPRGPVRLSVSSSNDDGEPLMSAPVDLEIGDANIDGLELPLMPVFELKGRIDWDGPAGEFHDLKVQLDPLREMDQPISSGIAAEGAFRVTEVKPDRYRVSLSGASGNTYVKSVRLGSREMPDGILDVRRGAGQPLSLILSTAGGQLSGVARDADGPLMEAAVGLADDRPGPFNALRVARTNGDGSYVFHALPPGNYKLFLFEPEDLRSLVRSGALGVYDASADKIEIAEGDKLVRDLRQ